MAVQDATITVQAQVIRKFLSEWAIGEGGIAVVAHDLNHFWEIAFNTSKVPRCIICYAGEDIRGDFSVAAYDSRVDRHWVVMVTRGKGYTQDRGATLTENIGEARPFYDLLEEARDIIRVLQFDPSVVEAGPGLPVDYRGIKPALPEDYPLDAYLIEFSIGTQLGIPQFFAHPQTPPSAPFKLVVTSGSAILNWKVDSFDADGSFVFRSTDGVSFASYDTVNGADVVTYTDTVVMGGNQYWYKVNRFNTAGSSSFSNTATISF